MGHPDFGQGITEAIPWIQAGRGRPASTTDFLDGSARNNKRRGLDANVEDAYNLQMNFIKKVVIVALLFFLGLNAYADTPKEQARALFDRSAAVSSFWDSYPYHLVIKLPAIGTKTPMSGVLKIDALNRLQYRTRVDLGEYSELESHDGKYIWRKSNVEYQPPLIEDLWGSLRPLAEIPIIYDPKRIYDAEKDGQKVTCVDYDYNDTTACFAVDTGFLLSKKTRQYSALYSAYEQQIGKAVPTRIAVETYDGKHFEATLQLSEAKDLTSQMLTPPTNAGFEQQPVCRRATEPPQLNISPKPQFPEGEKNNGIEVLKVWVSTEGKVKHLEFRHSIGQPYDKAAAEAVRNWIYVPASCEGRPLEASIDVLINFQR